MKRLACTAFTTLCLVATPLTASALTLQDWTLTGPGSFHDHSAPGLLAFDFEPHSLHTVLSATYVLGSEDIAAGLSFNTVVRSLVAPALGIEVLRLGLSGMTFAAAGSVSRAFGGTTSVAFDPQSVSLHFDPPEFFEVEVGDAFGTTAGASNWTLSAAGLSVGDRITITAAVPEPETWAMLAVGLGMLAAAARARRRG